MTDENLKWSFLMYLSYFVLFFHFFYFAYIAKKKAAATNGKTVHQNCTSKQLHNGHANGNGLANGLDRAKMNNNGREVVVSNGNGVHHSKDE